MKLKINLGVPTEALLKHPTACFNLSKAMTRVSDALAFGEFYIKQTKGNVVTARDLEHMSASIWTSSRSAEDLGKLVGDPSLRRAVDAYRKDAARLNAAIRSNLPEEKAKAKSKGAEKVTVPLLRTQTTALRGKLADIEKKVESLCTVDKPAPAIDTSEMHEPQFHRIYKPTTSAMKGRAGMSGSGVTLKKRPMYPRYFVASMGRSRR